MAIDMDEQTKEKYLRNPRYLYLLMHVPVFFLLLIQNDINGFLSFVALLTFSGVIVFCAALFFAVLFMSCAYLLWFSMHVKKGNKGRQLHTVNVPLKEVLKTQALVLLVGASFLFSK